MTQEISTVVAIKQSRDTALSLLAPNFVEALAKIPEELLDKNELELEEHFNRTPNDYALRKRLWELVDTGKKDITFEDWSRGVCRSSYLRDKVVFQPHRLAWLFTPLQTHQEMFDEAFHLSFAKIRKYLQETQLNTENFGQYLAAFKELANRSVGPVARNINLRGMHVHKNVSAAPPPKDRESLEARIEELEQSKVVSLIDLEPE